MAQSTAAERKLYEEKGRMLSAGEIFRTTYIVWLNQNGEIPFIFHHAVQNREVPARISKKAYAYYFYDIVTQNVQFEGERIPLRSRRLNESGKFFIEGKRSGRKKIRGKFVYTKVQTRFGDVLDFKKEDQCVQITNKRKRHATA